MASLVAVSLLSVSACVLSYSHLRTDVYSAKAPDEQLNSK